MVYNNFEFNKPCLFVYNLLFKPQFLFQKTAETQWLLVKYKMSTNLMSQKTFLQKTVFQKLGAV
jgi:hypothetical protein